ncbi:TolC family protein [Clostridium tyrobutyricum]|uniref:TolC family protein n=1 Tax=Clostridium tyrobutyricum TaxID=1519 RepID=UPI001C3C668B|nr:TolC family protein [Clostridium tyrobutyricum]MBV4438460.1 TolC family protein [Clostridium tyrobutyricum]
MGKKSISTIIAISLGILLSSSTVFAQINSISSMDIKTAESISIKNSSDIESQDYSIQIAEIAYEQGKDASYKADNTLIMNQKMMDLMAKPDKTVEEEAIVANYVPLTNEQIYQLTKTRDVQPLEAEYNLEVAKNNRESIENTVTLSTYTQYINLLSNRDMIDTEEKNMNNISDLYNISKLKLELGTISKSQYKKIIASYNNETQLLSQKQRSLSIEEMNFNKLLGQDLNIKYSTLSADLPDNNYDINSLDYYVNSALKNNLDITNSINYISVKQKNYDVTNKIFPAKDNIYNKQAKYDLEESQDNLKIIKTNIQKNISDEYNLMLSKKKTLDTEINIYNSALKNYNIASNKYKYGVLSKLDMDSNEIQYQKECDKLNSLKRDLWIEKFKIDCQIDKGLYSTTIEK